MASIFISYRHEDSKGYAGRIFDRLKQHFGKDHVFMDIARIVPGSDFVESIEKALGSCDALLAVIGKQWLTMSDTNGRRRLEDPKDFIRLELITALRSNIRVIPVLVDNAGMPTPNDLPEGLKELARRQALELSDKRWDFDVEQLIQVLAGLPGVDDSLTKPPDSSPTGLQPRSYLGVASMIFVFSALPFALMMGWFTSMTTGAPFGKELALALPGGMGFGLAMGLICALFLRGRTISVSFADRDKFVSRINVALSEIGFNPATASGNFLSFKPSLQAGFLSGRISVVIQGSTATIVGAAWHIKKLQKRVGQ